MTDSPQSKKLQPGKLVAATHNQGKVRELRDLLVPLGFEPISAGDLDLPEPEETGSTFEANAELKALAAAKASGFPALADDSGLAVDALNGAPGIYSARWAGESKDFTVAMEKVNQALEDEKAADRSARFVCALCVAWPDGETVTYRGEVEGELVWPPRGNQGFGYDPIFVATGESITFGEMEPERKHAMSHRANAFKLLTEALL
ncbi:RdgB/HAM1 family non-canonical purine NTP pyrophosphatase [Hirschia maritima]|uniref:RdgB/HAM1 family non-canonical purine NTP pyrophosphatase n=1 Tax=Hirschia maritima TaxID=1121961 RepID=UPI00037C4136|nr:RdgB/HAM1 family non-canonical purine NTP pyrophosphatase [Hirschia maritima]